jgi:type II secretory ATPase GspE/PulE/Tfp pilus assembly ATPase PilB-like protein
MDQGSSQGGLRFASEGLMGELGHRLVADGVIEASQLSDYLSRSTLTGEPLDRLLLKDGVVAESVLLPRLADVAGIPCASMSQYKVDHATTGRLPSRAALKYKVVPVAADTSSVTLATSVAPGREMVDSLRLLLGGQIYFVLCPEAEVTRSIKHFYGLGAEALDEMISSAATNEIQETDLTEEGTDPGVLRFVNQLIAEAIRMDATDVHIEPFESRMRVRYRIDGVLQVIPVPKGIEKLQKAIASAIKIMAQLNIAERRKPHDGRIKVRLGENEFDLRVSILPTRYGETIDLRILNRNSMFIDLEHLGLKGHQIPIIESLSALPHGIVLITGPTGSGKTTTLYATLSRLNKEGVKIITAEDPIEYQMDGISQIQTHSQIGLTFSTILRSILRHNPDIVLVGEIRDTETAQIAVQAALTGHLVFSTLHTNDAPSAIVRLIDMGIEPYLVSSCLEGVIAQRLVRSVCTACREKAAPDPMILEEIARTYPGRVNEKTVFYKANGCALCNFTGYRGRKALFEMMVIDDDLRGMIAHQESSGQVRLKAMKNGLITLRQDGWSSVLDGITTIEEVLRVAHRVEATTYLGARKGMGQNA